VRAQRYLEHDYDYLAALTARESVAAALPLFIVGVPTAVLALRLARSPKGLARLLAAGGILLILSFVFSDINALLRGYVAERAVRGAILGLFAVATATMGAWLGGRLGAGSRAWPFDLIAGEIELWARSVRARRAIGWFFRPWLVPAIAVIVLGVFFVPSALAPAPPGGPPIVFILIDTLRADHLTCYGYARGTSPNIERFAAKATLFENAIAQGSWTKPSVASIFTSLYPSVHATGSGTRVRRRVDGDRIVMVPAPDDAPSTTGQLPAALFTMAEAFRQAGYRTAGFVANSLVAREDGYGQGFERYVTLDDVGLTEEGRHWIAQHPQRPFFLYLHYMAPHAPYAPPPEFDRFRTGSSDFQIHNSATKDSINFTRTLRPAEADLQALIDRYDGEILHADALVGEILSSLATTRLLDRAIVVVTSDHGEEFMEHGMVWHESVHLYDELIRVPLIVSVPGGRDSARVADVVMLVDLAPTLLELARIPVPDEMQGRSITSAFEVGSFEAEPAFVESLDWGDLAAVRDGTRKLIYNRETPGVELFDLVRDPAERDDLSSDHDADRGALMGVLARRASENLDRAERIPREMPALREDQRERLRSLGYIQ
jgi:arylsulfatase A-like enzyme